MQAYDILQDLLYFYEHDDDWRGDYLGSSANHTSSSKDSTSAVDFTGIHHDNASDQDAMSRIFHDVIHALCLLSLSDSQSQSQSRSQSDSHSHSYSRDEQSGQNSNFHSEVLDRTLSLLRAIEQMPEIQPDATMYAHVTDALAGRKGKPSTATIEDIIKKMHQKRRKYNKRK